MKAKTILLRMKALERDQLTCQNKECGKVYDGNGRMFHLHHIIPQSQGGMDELDNLITYCPKCHRRFEPRPELEIMTKLIKIKDETHSGLKGLAVYGDTLDSVIQRLINFYLKTAPKHAKKEMLKV